MKIAGPASRDYVEHRSPIVLGVSRTRHDIEFGGALHSERCTRNVEPGLVSPKTADFHTVQQNGSRVDPRARNAKSLRLSKVCAARRGPLERRNPRRNRYELLVIPPVEWQLLQLV